MSGILLSERHGVNPSVEQCFTCMRDVGVVLFGRLKGDREAPHRVCLGPNSEPCAECKKHMAMGVILISVRDPDPKDDPQNPYRTGGWVVVRNEFIERVVTPKWLADDILKRRMAFVPDDAWDMLGLPRGKPRHPKSWRK